MPVSKDFEGKAVPNYRELKKEAAERCEYRRTEEAKRAVEIVERVKTLGRLHE